MGVCANIISCTASEAMVRRMKRLFYFAEEWMFIAVNEMDLRMAVSMFPSRHATLTLHFPGLGKYSQPMGND
jgi:hypothetical protein